MKPKQTQPQKLFDMDSSNGDPSTKIVSTWRDHPGPVEPKDNFDTLDAQGQSTTAKIYLKDQGIRPKQAAQISNAKVAAKIVNDSIDDSKQERKIATEEQRARSLHELEGLLRDTQT